MFVRAPRHTLTAQESLSSRQKSKMVLMSMLQWIWVSRSSFCFTTVWYLDLITWQHFIPKIRTYFNRCQFPIFCKNVEPTFDISIISLRSYEKYTSHDIVFGRICSTINHYIFKPWMILVSRTSYLKFSFGCST